MAAAEDGRVRARQAALWVRARSLCRRLRALQARQVERHFRQQLVGLARSVAAPPPEPSAPAAPSPAALRAELRHLAARAAARLRQAQRGCDSDATDSSASSAASDSDGAEPAPRSPDSLDGQRLAERQWATERAAIICRWTWLQAQVSDLEYRIRQQTDVYKQLRANKGPVVLGDLKHEEALQQSVGSTAAAKSRRSKAPPPSSQDGQCDLSPCIPSLFLPSADKQNSHLAQPLRNRVCPVSGSAEPSKDCTSPSQVNGISNCFSTCASTNHSRSGAEAERVLRKPRATNNSLPPASSLDSSCVAARIRPVCTYRKRRLVRVNTVSHLSRKPLKPLSMRCSCELPNSCILCGCTSPVQTIDPETMSLEERIAVLDSGFHPILSFSHGSALHFHFDALLREDHRISPKLRSLKMPHWGMKDVTNNFCSSSLTASGSLLKRTVNHGLFVPDLQTHKHHVPSLCLENTPAPLSAPPGSASALPSKKKKIECSYDINNIVIPMSMAATVRVEKLQYKEILTPSWRVVDPKELETFGDTDSELEDTSDERYLNHHQKFEELERVRWDSWTGNVSHKRGNRSSNKADGRWMLQPGSPDSVSPDLDHIPCLNSFAGPLDPELAEVPQPVLAKGRSNDETAVYTPEKNIQPWEPRRFPLSEEEYRALQEPPPDTHDRQTGSVQLWDSGSLGGFRTNNIGSGEVFLSKWQLHSDGGTRQEEPHIASRLISDR